MAGRPLVLRYAARSDVGKIRAKNDDSAYVGQYLAVVADGMGGHAGGDVASASTVLDLIHLDRDGYAGDAGTYLADEIQTANSLLSQLVHVQPTLAGMGTTVTALLLSGDKLEFAHIGDSRAYRLKDGIFKQISVDHTFVQRLIDEGRLRPEEAETHPHKNVLMRVLGDVDASPELDLSTFDAAVGERWLLCSDGLNFVPTPVIEDVVRGSSDLGSCADKLIELTLAAGSPDNVTVVLFEVAVPMTDDLATASLATVDISQAKIDDDAAGGRQRRSGKAGQAAARGAANGAGFGVLSAPDPTGDAGDPTDIVPAGVDELRPRPQPDPGLPGEPSAQRDPRDPTAPSAPIDDGHADEHDQHDGHAKELGAHISAAVIQEELAARPHELVGAAVSAAAEGTIPVVAGRAAARRAATVLTHKPEPVGAAEDDVPTDAAPLRRRRVLISIAAAVVVLILVAATWLGYAWTQTRYYLGDSHGHVAIFKGVSQSLGPLQLSHLYRETDITVASLPDFSRQRLQQTVPAAGLDDARQIITDLQLGTGAPPCPSPSASTSRPTSKSTGTTRPTSPATSRPDPSSTPRPTSPSTATASGPPGHSAPPGKPTAAATARPSPAPTASAANTATPCAGGAP